MTLIEHELTASRKGSLDSGDPTRRHPHRNPNPVFHADKKFARKSKFSKHLAEQRTLSLKQLESASKLVMPKRKTRREQSDSRKPAPIPFPEDPERRRTSHT